MSLPNLIGCGAGKSGTTSLYYYLSEHPEVQMSVAKEIHFFSRHYDRGIDWYEKQFRSGGNPRVVGEFSTTYMLDPEVPERIASLVPDAKLLFIFRNPASRAYSSFWFTVHLGAQSAAESFSSVIRTQEGAEQYLKAGFYFDHLSRFLRHFDRSQIHVMITEDLHRDPGSQMAQCYEFLGIDPTFRADFSKQFNETVVATNRWKHALDRGWRSAKSSIKPVFYWVPGSLKKRFREIEQKVRRRLNAGRKPEMSNDDRAYLEAVYRDSNQRLAEYLGRSLPW